MSGLRLIGDIGGTNARFAIAEHGRYGDLSHVEVKQYATLQDALAAYLKKLPAGRRPTSAALAVAGPVSGDEIALTNLNWSFSILAIEKALGLSSLKVFNDFAATAMAIPCLPLFDSYTVGTVAPGTDGPIGVIGPGTGLGVSALVPNGDRLVLLPGEGGHVTMPAVTAREERVLDVLRQRWPHVSAERVLSGSGLVNLYQALCSLEGKTPAELSPADVSGAAVAVTDPICVEAFAMFCAMLGTVAGNLALTLGATGGVYIAGGILLRFKEAFAASPFRARFEDKGRFQSYLRKIPTVLILEESPALLGLANLPAQS